MHAKLQIVFSDYRLDLTLQSLRNKIFPLDKETGKAPEVVPSVQSAAKGKEKEKAPSPLGVSSLIVSVENVDELLEFDSDTILSSLSSSDMVLFTVFCLFVILVN